MARCQDDFENNEGAIVDPTDILSLATKVVKVTTRAPDSMCTSKSVDFKERMNITYR